METNNIKPEDEQIDKMNEKRSKEFLDEEEMEMTAEQKERIAGESKYNLCGDL